MGDVLEFKKKQVEQKQEYRVMSALEVFHRMMYLENLLLEMEEITDDQSTWRDRYRRIKDLIRGRKSEGY